MNPITWEIVEDNVTQRDMLKFVAKDLMGLWSSQQQGKPGGTIQIFNNAGNGNKFA
jgi:hypothetical protein